MRRLSKLVPITWLMVLLLVPAGAYLLGARQPLLENREKTPIPDLNRGTLRKAATFQQLDAAILERLPLRGDALNVRGRIAVDVFRDSPNADVVLGQDRWLYYRPELRVCEPDGRPATSPADAAEILTRTIRASGRKPVVLVAGSKIVTHREHLRGFDSGPLACVTRTEAEVQRRLAETPGGLTIQPQLEALEAAGKPTFLRSDTHWNFRGREVFARSVLDAIHPGLADEADLRAQGEQEYEGDLGGFIGEKRVDHGPVLTANGTPKTTFAPGEILFVGDSQLGGALRTAGANGVSVLDRMFPGQPTCDWPAVQTGPCDQPLLDARTVVVETVARNLREFVESCPRPTAALAAGLRGRPARWTGDGSPSRLPLNGQPSEVRVEARNDDRTDVPRLLRIPVRTLPADPTADPAAPPTITVTPTVARSCMSTSATAEGGVMLIPILAGERVADVPLQASGPAGAALGAPEILRLDGTRLPTRN